MNLLSFRRKAGYLFWGFLEEFMNAGLPRFVLFPVAAYFIGKEAFGAFVTAISVVSIIGITPSTGISIGLLRHVSEYPEDQWPRFYYTAMHLSRLAMLCLAACSIIGVALAAALRLSPGLVLACLLPLLFSLYPDNQFFLALTETRIRRQFAARGIWISLRTVLIVAVALVGLAIGELVQQTPAARAIGFSWGYAIGMSIAYLVAWWRRRSWDRETYDVGMAKLLKSIWFHMTLAGILAYSGQYLVRIFVSIWQSFEDVSDFYAGAVVVNLFMTPALCIGPVALSLLARYKTIHDLSRQARLQYFALVFGSVSVLPLLVYLFGPWTLRLMFPTFGDRGAELLDILLWSAPCACLAVLMRPLVVKFGKVQSVPLVNGVSLVATILPCILLIPRFGINGAAWAYLFGRTVTGTIWLVLALKLFWQARNVSGAAEPGESLSIPVIEP